MHPQLRPIMQLGPSGAKWAAPGASPDIAFVSGVRALAPAPTTAAPHPTIKTNRPALARSVAFDLQMFVITCTVGAGRPMRISKARRLAGVRAIGKGFAVRAVKLPSLQHVS
jgi:hypothetical protein